MPKLKPKKQSYIYSVGKRKSASARIRLFTGKGESTVNGKKITDYFSGPILGDIWSRPFKVIDASNKFYVTVKVNGGGKMGQVEAVAHGIARALTKQKEEFKKPLKDAGLLKRDSRIRERRKVGTGGKARRKKQSPKR
ncbi:30S ribosomal protein S9 [Candidatus Woesebacteria bacterium RIFCSPLOWO2_01_FULL_39_61]|uniref:30S ribosomal protein S9 n=2 Tax=Microgenomates group TaxID=1794810 RepID=A0A0H4T5E1_9BACT|nr:30S ribosomal protein S9, small subunit ribosomal protein S9 [uncultured Microgenomates bacterium Rifle_16ft_4_minimus_37836]OGM28061.1 MAG: 30S ribosomal protein S9 [Candidatus Woesebacteria bacterium RIFCSPHIGHO2_01_FULL_39_95]OGM34049.1 MAG: 30S ribosomal protein S9 [Candidatus Woesebacteria bacterium RIFCSPHIGHO2_02_FULL_39_13]OGM38307.1 MAG: 30S ribosomal protein S9 [Candidatus Woesebacteria bacterium RIFCSPHIGHO2_12_FULL_40_20]OGM67770.1 MAG: 30S ribosomal protein S9 [Candidatus Woeseb